MPSAIRLGLFATILIVLSCKKKDVTVAPSVRTDSVFQVTLTSAQVALTVTADGGGPVTERGVFFGTAPLPNAGGTRVTSGTGTGAASVTLNGLKEGTTYQVRAFAQNSVGISYGNTLEFTTAKVNAPTVRTDSVSQVTASSAQVAVTVSADGGGPVSERGVFFGTAPLPSGGGTRIASGIGTGSFSVALSALATGTAYQVRAYAQNSAGISYGNTLDFTTVRVVAPTFNDSGVTVGAIGANQATVYLPSLPNNGGGSTQERGVVWGRSPNPAVGTADKKALTADNRAQQTNVTGLSSKVTYYIREYLVNAAGTFYGSQAEFKTMADAQTVEVGDLFGGGIVFYLLKPGDAGYDAGRKKGYVAEAFVSTSGWQWHNGSTLIFTGTTASAVGAGKSNTDSIVFKQGTGTYAASRCQNLVLNGFDDWYLPSLGELQLMQANIKSTFLGLSYWSSTEFDRLNAYYMYGPDGTTGTGAKANKYLVRAVRNF